MFTVVSWLAVRRFLGLTGDEEAELEGRLMRAFDVFLDGCRSEAS